MLQRPPRGELAPFVSLLWSVDVAGTAPGDRELVLPTGASHVVIRLDHPLCLYATADAEEGRTVGMAVVGGARSSAYVRDVSRPSRSVGAQLRPGAAGLLLGAPADLLAERHTPLDAVWGAFAGELRGRLCAEREPARRLDLFEAALVARLPKVRGIHPAVAHALARFADADAAGDAIGEVVDEVGCSHRRFIALFHGAVGLTPKVYCRVRRLQRALSGVGARPLAEVAVDAGYSDQAHMSREFRALAGVTPREYRARAATSGNHVPLRRG
jgi:AraC-like DNA-binding protein